MQGQGEIRFVVSEGRRQAAVKVYDIAGRLVRDLGTHEVGIGTHAIPWDGRTDSGTLAGNGMYFIRLTTDQEAVALALGAIWLAARPPSDKRTYGWYRAEILAATINSVIRAT